MHTKNVKISSDMSGKAASFSAESFEGQVFQNISGITDELRRKEFSGCIFKDCDLVECDFSGSSFTDCQFDNCNLSNVKVDNCRFRSVIFEDSKLVGVLFTRINPFLLRWVFKGCKIELCNFSGIKMPHSQFVRSFIRESDFINVDLRGSNFSGSDFVC